MPATEPQTEKLLHLHTLPELVAYLVEELHWPITVDTWEDAFFEWTPEELNLKPEHEVAIRGIKQLRPLASNQPWGIFFVDFDKRQLPIVVLRRVLNGLAIKRRTTGGGHQTWHARDLLFISSFGEGTTDSPREIALAHFSDESEVGDLPTLRVLGWDAADTPLELRHVAATLKSKLIWPQATQTQADLDAWRAQWAGAFRLQKNQVINDSKSLALALAELARNIRSRVTAVLNLESERGQLRLLHKAFKDNLIADLTEDGFADMYAQTITYGLFAARASRGSGALVADDAALMVPSTNPFLRDLLQDFLTAGGRAHRRDRRVDFDELGINEVVQTLRDVPMDAVLRAFNNDKPGDDPVIHFYEDFLKAYDKKLRAKRGVFYTPRPVVQFIVCSIDEILKTEFHIEDGLASTITWGEYLARLPLPQAGEGGGEGDGVTAKPPLQLPAHCTANTPFVQVLDPATGTATFLVEIIDLIHRHMKAKWRKDGCLTEDDFKPRWNVYVREHLLPRLYGFELMMAPYAIAHMKIGLKLAETGYTFPEDGPRVKVFLTNALEPAHPLQAQLETMAPMLAHEAASANEVKERLAATVVVGNPPYANYSSNLTPENRRLVDSYRLFRGQPIRERNQLQFERNIQDDFVKFVALAERYTLRSGVCAVGYITNATMLSSPSLRGMREQLMLTFTALTELHLHGGVNESFIDIPDDTNVFEIAQAVAIHLFCRNGGDGASHILYGDLRGSRQRKYDVLGCGSASELAWQTVVPDERTCGFSAQDTDAITGMSTLDAIFVQYGAGVKTNRDATAIGFDLSTLKRQIAAFNPSIWSGGRLSPDVKPIAYRPFDERLIFYREEVVASRSLPTMCHMLNGPNIGIIASGSWTTPQRFSVGVSKMMVEMKTGTHDRGTTFFPLRLAMSAGERGVYTWTHNFTPEFVRSLKEATGLRVRDFAEQTDNDAATSEAILHYLYAVFHSVEYRKRFATSLAQSFPLVLLPRSRTIFHAVAALGEQLVIWHLLEHEGALRINFSASKLPTPDPFLLSGQSTGPDWFGTDRKLEKVAETGRALAEQVRLASGLSDRTASLAPEERAGVMVDQVGKVFVNATSGFANVRVAVWQHTIGGYQVLHKWLDDRRKAGRSLSDDDITHWLRVYAALEATQDLMQQVDAAIDAHGGWPTEADGKKLGGAFSLNHPPPDATTLAVERATLDQQLKAQKKAIKAAAKNTQHDASATTSVTGGLPSTMSLFGADADLDDLAAATGETNTPGTTPTSGATPRPKREATPARAAGGAPSSAATLPALRIEDVSDWDMMCAIRAVLSREGTLARDALIRNVAHELGFSRTGTHIASALDDAIRRAVRRGIAHNQASELSLVARNVEGYDRAFLKTHLISVLSNTWLPKTDVPTAFARMLGFARTGSVIEETVWNLMRALIRANDVESDGRGDGTRYRKSRK